MNAHLVSSSGFKPAFDQGGASKGFDRAIMGYGMLAASFLDQRHFLAVGAGPGDRATHRSISRNRLTANQCKVCAMDRMVGKLLGEALVRSIGFCHHQQARRLLVDPMDDAGAGNPANT